MDESNEASMWPAPSDGQVILALREVRHRVSCMLCGDDDADVLTTREGSIAVDLLRQGLPARSTALVIAARRKTHRGARG